MQCGIVRTVLYEVGMTKAMTISLDEKEQEVLLDSMHDGIWVIDSQGITLRINNAMERIAGIKSEDVIGKHVTTAMRDLKFTACVTLRALEEKRTVTMFDDYANGRRCLNTSTPIFDTEGNVWRVIASIRDITELDSMHARLSDLERANQNYKTQLESFDNHGIVGISEASAALRKNILKAAKSDALCLILGDTGTGKSLTARRIHEHSTRGAAGPFVALNCGGIPAQLVESELFGYERGAFTGALREGKKGVFELAAEGTLFLDEVAELPLPMQATLLHVLDDGSFRRVGGSKELKSDVRIIAATNKDLEDMVVQGTFREDLFYRLRVLSVKIPSLRQRPEDIPELMYHFLQTLEGDEEKHRSFAPAVISALMAYTWPGNIRELRGIVQYLHTMTEGSIFRMEDLPSYFLADLPVDKVPLYPHASSLKEAVEHVEKNLISTALRELGSTYKAAKRLKVSQSTIVRKAQKYCINLNNVNDDV